MNDARKPRIALWFRYGPAEHAELFHAIPHIIQTLAQQAEVHYFGMRSTKPIPDSIRQHSTLHILPFQIDRTRNRDKFLKTLLWILCIPWIGLRCRLMGVQVVYIDETIPLTAPWARFFFGRNVAVTVADFFLAIYEAHIPPLLKPMARLVQASDRATWRKLPLLFTRAKNTRTYLASQGVPPERVHPVYDPCDFTIYHPTDGSAIRTQYNIPPDAVVLVHHGIVHPNKGNDLIIRALATHRERFPDLHYLLIGDGPALPALKELTATLDMTDRVSFTGWLPTLTEVNEALNAGDIGLVMRVGMPSDDFHMTGALVHAMACGLPILAAHLAGVAEVVEEGVNGHLFDPHTLNDFPDQLEKLYRDTDQRSRLGTQALTDARRHFDMATVTRQTVDPLLALLNLPPTEGS